MDLQNMSGLEALEMLSGLYERVHAGLKSASAEKEFENISDVTKGTLLGIQVCIDSINMLLTASGMALERPVINDSTGVPMGLEQLFQKKSQEGDGT